VLASEGVRGSDWDEVDLGRSPVDSEAGSSVRTIGQRDCGENITPSCPSDFDGSGGVDINDLVGVLGAFGSSDPLYDIDMDGKVDIDDLVRVLGDFGTSCD